jgi:hypothetical protein
MTDDTIRKVMSKILTKFDTMTTTLRLKEPTGDGDDANGPSLAGVIKNSDVFRDCLDLFGTQQQGEEQTRAREAFRARSLAAGAAASARAMGGTGPGGKLPAQMGKLSAQMGKAGSGFMAPAALAMCGGDKDGVAFDLVHKKTGE